MFGFRPKFRKGKREGGTAGEGEGNTCRPHFFNLGLQYRKEGKKVGEGGKRGRLKLTLWDKRKKKKKKGGRTPPLSLIIMCSRRRGKAWEEGGGGRGKKMGGREVFLTNYLSRGKEGGGKRN